ncbi:amidohydrolase family protein [SAR202 cluster bacterium AC-409-J13_OGT_754m]|nr:amidohydrolase family protein [SAR202 cluster bacterium AC-409-J13_OGT_754m]
MHLIIRNVRLIDGTGRDPLLSITVVVENGVITSIGDDKPLTLNHKHYEDINGEDLTLLPGIFDAHEHFAGDGGKNGVWAMADDSREVLLAKGASNARRALMTGQTSARDVGSPHGVSITLAQQVASGSIPGPRITAAGSWIQAPTTWPYPFVTMIENKEEMRNVINLQIEQGAGLIKVGATGTYEDGSDYATLGPEIATMVVEMAHSAGLKTAAHSVGVAGTKEVVRAGIDSVEHGFFIDEETSILMAKKGTVLVPTMSTWDNRLQHAVSWGLTKDEIQSSEMRKEGSIQSFKRCLASGVKVAAGTDAGGCPVRHGTLVREMEVMIEAGLTTMQAIEAATRTPAELAGTLKDVGTIEVGKLADLILVDGDPLDDIGALRNIWAVFQGGRRIR